MNPKHFVFFDVGDTLISLKKPAGQIYFDVLKQYKVIPNTYQPSDLKKLFGQVWLEINSNPSKDYKDRYATHPNGNNGWWIDLINLFLKKLDYHGQNISEEVYSAIFKEFDSPDTWQIESSFFELEKFCREFGIRMGIISNWDLRLRPLLIQLDIIRYFEIVIISAEFGYEKPSPLIFQQAMNLSQTPKEYLTFIGDKEELDYFPALKMGWDSYLISKHKKPGKKVIQKLSDLITIKKWE